MPLLGIHPRRWDLLGISTMRFLFRTDREPPSAHSASMAERALEVGGLVSRSRPLRAEDGSRSEKVARKTVVCIWKRGMIR